MQSSSEGWKGKEASSRRPEGRTELGPMPLNLKFQAGVCRRRRLRPILKVLWEKGGRRGKGGTSLALGRREEVKRLGKGRSDPATGWKRRGWRGGEKATQSALRRGHHVSAPLTRTQPRDGEPRTVVPSC